MAQPSILPAGNQLGKGWSSSVPRCRCGYRPARTRRASLPRHRRRVFRTLLVIARSAAPAVAIQCRAPCRYARSIASGHRAFRSVAFPSRLSGVAIIKPITIPKATIAAYRATTYRIELDASRVIDLRIDIANPDLVALHGTRRVRSSVFVTAWNPFGVKRSDAENEAAMTRLEEWLDERGIAWLRGSGIGDDGAWPTEPSLLALGVSRDQADTLCVSFRQNAVVVCGSDGVPQLHLHPEVQLDGCHSTLVPWPPGRRFDRMNRDPGGTV